MNWFEKAVKVLYDWRMPKPPFYGWYHLLWLAIMVIACALVIIFRRKISKKAVRITLIVWGSAIIFLEIIKQVLVSFHIVHGSVVWAYAWASFPFQFCSSPLYVALPAGILKKGKVKEALQSFIALFAIIGGFAAMVYPANMFSHLTFINLHTMVWHVSMVTVSVMLLATRTVKFEFFSLLKGFVVFIILTVVALILNAILGKSTGINLFYISPYFAFNVPIVTWCYEHLSYPVYFFVYIIAFTLAAAAVLFGAMAGEKLEERISQKRQERIEQIA